MLFARHSRAALAESQTDPPPMVTTPSAPSSALTTRITSARGVWAWMPVTSVWNLSPNIRHTLSASPPGALRLLVDITASRRAESRRAASGSASAIGTPKAMVC